MYDDRLEELLAEAEDSIEKMNTDQRKVFEAIKKALDS